MVRCNTSNKSDGFGHLCSKCLAGLQPWEDSFGTSDHLASITQRNAGKLQLLSSIDLGPGGGQGGMEVLDSFLAKFVNQGTQVTMSCCPFHAVMACVGYFPCSHQIIQETVLHV